MKFHPLSLVIVLWIGVTIAACGDSDAADGPDADPRTQALSYAREDISCTTADDCCAVLDGCLAQFLIVSAADELKVEQLLARTDSDACVDCIPPMVQVDCMAGRCGARLLESTGGFSDVVPVDFVRTHCGRIDVPEGWAEKVIPAAPTEPASFQPKIVVGC